MIWGMLSEQRCRKYWCPVLKYNITFGIKSPKCLVSCLFRLILFALGIKALFEIDYAKIKIHAPFNSNSYCMFREKRRSIQKKKMTLFHTPPRTELDLVPLTTPQLSRPMQSRGTVSVCPRKACKQHPQPWGDGTARGSSEERVEESSQLLWGQR